MANGKIQRVADALTAKDPGCIMCTRRWCGTAVAPREPWDSGASITLIAIMARFYADTKESAASIRWYQRPGLIERGTSVRSDPNESRTVMRNTIDQVRTGVRKSALEISQSTFSTVGDRDIFKLRKQSDLVLVNYSGISCEQVLECTPIMV